MRQDEYQISFSFKELVSAYLLMQQNTTADIIAEGVIVKFREILYNELTIDEMERLSEYYKSL